MRSTRWTLVLVISTLALAVALFSARATVSAARGKAGAPPAWLRAAADGNSRLAIGQTTGVVGDQAAKSAGTTLMRDPAVQFVQSQTIALPFFPYALAEGDFNGDGITDLAVVGNLTSNSRGVVFVFLGKGNGRFAPGPSFTIASGGKTPVSIGVADVNGDGRLDLVVVNVGHNTIGSVTVLRGNGDGTFTQGTSVTTGGVGSAVLGDFNGDGITDVAVSVGYRQPQVKIFLGNGDGTFRELGSVKLPMGAFDLMAADLNGDGKLDLVLPSGGQGGQFYVALGNGDGTFQPAMTRDVPSGFTAIGLGDFNGDGIPDVGFSEHELFCDGASKGYVGVELGNGDGTFQKAIVTNTTDRCGYLGTAVADFNGDGIADLLAINFTNVGLFLGNGDGTLEPEEAALGLATNPGPLLVGDLNGDGAPDFVSVQGNGFTIALNASGSFVTLTASPNPSQVGQAVTFTAGVAPSLGQKTQPAGSVTFQDGTTSLGTVTLASGQATLTISTLSAGSHTITALYSGDAKYIPESSPALTQIVNP